MIQVFFNGHKFTAQHFVFSGGEVQTTLDLGDIAWTGDVLIVAHLHNADDIMSLLQVKDILDRKLPRCDVELAIPYAPYARQDRVCSTGESLSAKVSANLINSCNFKRVTTLDCHSEVLPALIDRCENFPVEWFIKNRGKGLNLILRDTRCVLISPDAGANKKVHNVAKAYGGLTVIRADKIRDTLTGDITGTEVYCDNLRGVHCVIVDDICDGGMTFIKLAEKLKEKGAGLITLYVTHGIFSKGLDVFDGLIDQVYTSDSFRSGITHSKLKICKI